MSAKSELTVTGHLKNLEKIAHFVIQAATQAGLDDRASYAVQMAVDEACTNIIQHGYQGEGKGKIRLICETHHEGLQVIIYDHGRSFDPKRVPELNTDAPLEARDLGGMGLFFVYKLMDRVEFNFGTPEGNQLILFKRREPAA